MRLCLSACLCVTFLAGPGGVLHATPGRKIKSVFQAASTRVKIPLTSVHPLAGTEKKLAVRNLERALQTQIGPAAREHIVLDRDGFYYWLQFMHRASNRPKIVDENTFDALFLLSRAITVDHKRREPRRSVTYLLQTVNDYADLLGERDGRFYKLVYRGGLTNQTVLPSADQFHLLAEEYGLDAHTLPAEELKNLYQGDTEDNPYCVYLTVRNGKITGLNMGKRTTTATSKHDLEEVIRLILPPGYTVRMGLHELGVVGSDLSAFHSGMLHIHFEKNTAQVTPEGLQIDYSIVLDIQAGRFAQHYDEDTRKMEPFPDQKIARNYLALLGSFLDEEAWNFLQKLAR